MAHDGTMMGVDDYFASDAGDDLRIVNDAGGEGADESNDPYERRDAQRANLAEIRQSLAPIPDGGPLLEEPSGKKIFQAIKREIDRQEPLAESREAKKKHWDAVMGGCQFSILEKSEDQSIWTQKFPPDVDHAPQPIPNKVATLGRRIISQITTDPFLPDPKPDGANSDRNRGAADLTKKYLRHDGSPSGTHDQGMLLEALSINMTGASSFAWTWIDKMGGGWRPMQKNAHPHATDATNPLVGPKLGPDNQPIQIPDPSAPGGMKVVTERTTTPILRYVTEDGQFTTDPAAAARQWMPKHRRRVLGPAHVRTHPPTAEVRHAKKVTILAVETLGEAKDRLPVLHTLNKAQLTSLCKWRPKRWKVLVPEALRAKGGSVAYDEGGDVSDDTLIFWYHHYCRVSGDYQDGAEIAVSGGMGGFLLLRDTLREDVKIDDGTLVPVQMDPGLAQFKAYHDPEDPAFGMAGIAGFGGSNELRAHLLISILDANDKTLNPNTFIPSTSPVTRQDLTRRDGTPIEILTAEDKPQYEQTPQIPAQAFELLKEIDKEMNAEAGLSEAANGLDSEYSTSGVAKDISIKQSRLALAWYWQNTAAGMIAYWTNKTQQARAKLTVPQEVMLAGTESAYKQRWFVGGDLIGVGPISLQSGSGTMMGPMEKVNLAGVMQQGQFITPEDAGELARANMTDDLGLTANPHEERADRQIGAWIDGPPPEWEATFQRNQEATQAYQQQIQTVASQMAAGFTSQGLDPASAQQQAMAAAQQQIPQPTLEPLFNPFEPRANDEEPTVALIRARKLSRVLSSPDYDKWGPAWQKNLNDAYAGACYAASITTVRQQAEAAQQAAAQAATQQNTANNAATVAKEKGAQANVEAKQQQAVASTEAKSADAHAAREHQSAEAARDREHQTSLAAADREQALFSDVFNSVLGARSKGLQQRYASQRSQPSLVS